MRTDHSRGLTGKPHGRRFRINSGFTSNVALILLTGTVGHPEIRFPFYREKISERIQARLRLQFMTDAYSPIFYWICPD